MTLCRTETFHFARVDTCLSSVSMRLLLCVVLKAGMRNFCGIGVREDSAGHRYLIASLTYKELNNDHQNEAQ